MDPEALRAELVRHGRAGEASLVARRARHRKADHLGVVQCSPLGPEIDVSISGSVKERYFGRLDGVCSKTRNVLHGVRETRIFSTVCNPAPRCASQPSSPARPQVAKVQQLPASRLEPLRAWLQYTGQSDFVACWERTACVLLGVVIGSY